MPLLFPPVNARFEKRFVPAPSGLQRRQADTAAENGLTQGIGLFILGEEE